MTKRLLFTLALALLTASGCNLIYKQSIQQGNALEQEDLDKLRIGMSMNQVSFLLGTPAIQDPFHHDRWDYVSTFSRRGDPAVMRKVTLYFENGALSEMIGVEGNEFIFEEEPVEEAPDEVPVATAAAMDEANDTLTENDSPGAEVTALESPQAEELPYEVSARKQCRQRAMRCPRRKPGSSRRKTPQPSSSNPLPLLPETAGSCSWGLSTQKKTQAACWNDSMRRAIPRA
jgi:outer membrane protein assembly factor BamE